MNWYWPKQSSLQNSQITNLEHELRLIDDEFDIGQYQGLVTSETLEAGPMLLDLARRTVREYGRLCLFIRGLLPGPCTTFGGPRIYICLSLRMNIVFQYVFLELVN